MAEKQKYDVFLSYSRPDTESVENLARALGDAGVHVWLDKWNLIPGQSWQNVLKEAIRNASAVAICIGSAGLGSWQQEEFRAASSAQVSERPQIIPVLLPGARTDSIPSFLRNVAWADFRDGINNPREMARIVAAIESTQIGGEIDQEERIGDDLRSSGDISGALQHYERAIQVAKAAYSDNHPKIADLLLRLANVKQDLGDYAAAMALLEQSIVLISEVYGNDSEQIASAFNNLGSIMRDRGDLDGAQMYFERALAIDQKALGPDHPNVAITLNNLAGVLLARGDHESALRAYRKAYNLLKMTLGEEHPHSAEVRSNLNRLENFRKENST